MSGGKILLDVAIEWMMYVHLMIEYANNLCFCLGDSSLSFGHFVV